jgi:hypothetical protein
MPEIFFYVSKNYGDCWHHFRTKRYPTVFNLKSVIYKYDKRLSSGGHEEFYLLGYNAV